MRRARYLALAALATLAVPFSAQADGPVISKPGCENGRCLVGGSRGGKPGWLHGNGLFAGGGHGGHGGFAGWKDGKHGLFGSGALANAPPTYPDKFGHGFFQPPFQASPWYLYWPYDAHFQLPAPIGAPFYPPQSFNTPWNPYFPHPAQGPGAVPPPPHHGGFGFAPSPAYGAAAPGSELPPPIPGK